MRFIVPFLSLLLVIQAAIISINLFADEDGRVWRDFEKERWMTKEMHIGNNIAGRQNFQIRVLVTEIIKQAESPPDILVLGSSRSMLVGEALLGRSGVINNSISSARLVHYFSVLGQYMQRGLRPSKVVIGIDPWIFKNEKLIIWPMEGGAIDFANRLDIDAAKLGFDNNFPWTTYFSGDKAYKVLTKSANNANCDNLISIHNENTHCAIRRFDGSLKYPAELIAQSKEAVSADVARTARGRMHSYNGFSSIDPTRVEQLRRLLVYLKSEKISVDIFLAPYHPLVEAHQSGRRDWELTQEAEKRVRQMADDLEIVVLGSYSASIAGCDDSEFYDDIHAREPCVSRILGPILNTRTIRVKSHY